MRRTAVASLFFVFLISAATWTHATSSAKPENSAPLAVQVSGNQHAIKVKLNSADADTLRRDLFGIGAAKAKAIVAYRESNGPFTAVDELLEVKGIGKALLDKNRDRLEIN